MAIKESTPWSPGSFTKNFSWGQGTGTGLRQLHTAIRVGFADQESPVPRLLFRERLQKHSLLDFIPANFFLFNEIIGGESVIIVDELVFQALHAEHTKRFDSLALFALIFSHAGTWKGADSTQRYPALWASNYVRQRVARDFRWDTSRVNADDIDTFVSSSPKYTGRTSRKLATNLNFLFDKGHLSSFAEPRVTRWWVDSFFLALDRTIQDRRIDRDEVLESSYIEYLDQAHFRSLSGKPSIEKDLAARHLLTLYKACGGIERFSKEAIAARNAVRLEDLAYRPNDQRAIGAVHASNPRLLKLIPKLCAIIAKEVGFDLVDPDDLETFSSDDFIRSHTEAALRKLREQGAKPTMTADELMRITRGR